MAPDPAAIADAVARNVIALVPQRLATAATEAEREAIFRLRYQTVVELGWASPADFPGGLERNDDDEGALHVGAWEGPALVGSARVVPPRRATPLPIERDFGIEADSDQVEVGRTVITPGFRGQTDHGLVIALFAKCWLEMRALGFTELLSAIPPRLIEVYRSIGFEIRELGAGRTHWGEERIPVRFDVLGSTPELVRVWGAAGLELPLTGEIELPPSPG